MFSAWDIQLLLTINGSWHHPAVTAVLARVTWLGDYHVVLVVTLACVVCGVLRWPPARRRPLIAAGLGVFATFPVVAALKLLVHRARPDLPGLWVGTRESTASFPSGHAAGAFALAAFLSLGWPRWQVVWWTTAVVVAWSRMVLGVHYPTDCVVGALVGAGMVFVTVRISRNCGSS